MQDTGLFVMSRKRSLAFLFTRFIIKWFKHSTASHDDPDISDAWDTLGEFGYVGFFVILEIYGEEYSHRDNEDFITISKTFLRRKARKSWTNVELLLNFYLKRERILSKNSGDMIMIKIPKFIELASNWSRRPPTETPTETPTAKDIEVDKEEKDKDTIKKLNKEKQESWFNEFWSIYPKKVGKKTALKIWVKNINNRMVVDKIIEAVRNQRRLKMLNPENGYKYCPNPTTWINGEKWNDKYCELLQCNKCGSEVTLYQGEDNKCPSCDGVLR